ncbi:Protein IQ-DOMAIN 14 [Platanthera guangdongensis]|uniref:Protein IQ-DOMAIN 14 n=1 Tax=Platanthera guangdongensis TaxID=2320717 RepID=A0ABR2MA50_9ASPA
MMKQARKSYKAKKRIIRLKDMMEGPRVKRQTTNTMRSMQLLVRIQTQIHARRLQMMENQNAHQHQISWKSSNETFGNLSKWNVTNQLESEAQDDWDDSMMTKEEKEASVKRKAEAVMKRERSLAYAHSHQLLTITPKNAHSALNDARTGGHPLWWNWLEQQISSGFHHAKTPTLPTLRNPSATAAAGFALHPSSSRSKTVKSPFDASTPRFSKPLHTDNSSNRRRSVHARPIARDDDSLTSCPAFTTIASQAPNYMAPTVSAKAKVRPAATEGGGGGKVGKRRLSFALSQSIGSLRMFYSTKEAPPVKLSGGKHRPTTSVGELSVDSTVSLPAGLLRRPFK